MILENVLCAFENYSTLFGWRKLQMSVQSSWLIVLSRSSISMLIVYLVALPVIIQNVILKPPLLFSNCLFLPIILFLITFCFIYFGAQLLDAYMFIIVISSWWIEPFILKCHFVSTNTFVLKSVLSDIRIHTIPLMIINCMLYLFFKLFFNFKTICVFETKMCPL